MAIPVTLADAKAQLRLYDEDLTPERQAEIQGFIADAAGWVERYTGQILVARDVTEEFVGFGGLALKAWPVRQEAVPVVTYTGADGVATGVAAVCLASRRPARIVPCAGSRWPFAAGSTQVTVTVRAGYEAQDTVPANIRRAMLVLISAYDSDREGGEVFAKAEACARRLCGDYRARGL